MITTLPSGFQEFWRLYPRKVGKLAALKAWQKQRFMPHDIEAVIAAVTWQLTDPHLLGNDYQFVKHPATWLNSGGWLDEPMPKPQATPRETFTEARLRLFGR